MVKHNNVIPNVHLRKHWQKNVRVWLNQAGRKKRRLIARREKAATQGSRPLDMLRPAVRCTTIRYNHRPRIGRGKHSSKCRIHFGRNQSRRTRTTVRPIDRNRRRSQEKEQKPGISGTEQEQTPELPQQARAFPQERKETRNQGQARSRQRFCQKRWSRTRPKRQLPPSSHQESQIRLIRRTRQTQKGKCLQEPQAGMVQPEKRRKEGQKSQRSCREELSTRLSFI